MTSPDPTPAWIDDRLTELGGSGTVAELLERWQVELRAAAASMAEAGLLVVDGESWSLPAGRAPVAPTGRWTQDEIAIAVEAYVLLLRADHEGRPANRRTTAAGVIERTGRSAAAVDAIFANVSAVVQELGYEFLAAYPPKSNVPPGVRPAVAQALTP